MREPTLAEIQATRAADLTEEICQRCVDWAVSELVADRDTKSLRLLAGLSSPYDVFEVAELRDRALRECGAFPPLETTTLPYIREPAKQIISISVDVDLLTSLLAIQNLYLVRGHDAELYWASELAEAGYQFVNPEFSMFDESFHNPGITRSNFADLCHESAEDWLATFGAD